RVVVFRDDKPYSPFRPLYRKRTVAFTGYFQAGLDTNYIVLPLGLPAEDLYALPQHESVHLLIGSSARHVPDWLNEGLAQYYSTFCLSTRGGVLGAPIQRHVEFLRAHKLLTLAQLFQIERGSADYVEDERNDIFYAQSWALVHYLISGNEGRRQLQLLRFMEMLAVGLPVERSFQQAFHADYETIAAELAAYVGRGAYPVRSVSVDSRSGDTDLRGRSLTEAEAQSYLGDLLLHIERADDAAKYLQRAVALDPKLADARASLGMTRVRQRRFTEAEAELRQACARAPDSYRAHYYYAYALSREGMDEEQATTGYSTEVARAMRAELQRAITLAPRFPESYRLFAFVNLVTGERLDEAVTMLKQALTLSPGRPDLTFILAQVYLRQNDLTAAREMLEKVLRMSTTPHLRARAQTLLEGVRAGK